MDPTRFPPDYRTALAVAVAALIAMGWVEARMNRVAAMEVAPVRERVDEDRVTRRLILMKLDALCRATPQAQCPLGSE